MMRELNLDAVSVARPSPEAPLNRSRAAYEEWFCARRRYRSGADDLRRRAPPCTRPFPARGP
jgi:hypothetical protein